eukprot:scaffold754_cov248-Pinguiococcus_pyrenoidosus.AAC.10
MVILDSEAIGFTTASAVCVSVLFFCAASKASKNCFFSRSRLRFRICHQKRRSAGRRRERASYDRWWKGIARSLSRRRCMPGYPMVFSVTGTHLLLLQIRIHVEEGHERRLFQRLESGRLPIGKATLDPPKFRIPLRVDRPAVFIADSGGVCHHMHIFADSDVNGSSHDVHVSRSTKAYQNASSHNSNCTLSTSPSTPPAPVPATSRSSFAQRSPPTAFR